MKKTALFVITILLIGLSASNIITSQSPTQMVEPNLIDAVETGTGVLIPYTDNNLYFKDTIRTLNGLDLSLREMTGEVKAILQLSGPVQAEWKEELADMGVKIYSYIPNNAYIVNLPSSKISEVSELEYFGGMEPYSPEFKVTSELASLAGTQPNKNIMVLVQGFSSLELAAVEQSIENAGGSVIRSLPLNTILASMTAEAAASMAFKNVVSSIGVFHEKSIPDPIIYKDGEVPEGSGIQPSNYFTSRDIVGTYWANRLGLDGSGVVVGVMDTGLDLGDVAGADNDMDGLIDEDGPEPGVWINQDLDYFINEDDSDDDGDGFRDEEGPWLCDGIDNDGDGWIDEDLAGGVDDDGDGLIDEDSCNGLDDDGDGSVDEDPGGIDNDGDCLFAGPPDLCPFPFFVDEDPVEFGIDNDGDGLIDEDPGAIDNDGDGLFNEDSYDDDADGRLNEDPPNWGDNDFDGVWDEDGMLDDLPFLGYFAFRVDNDGDGFVDEDFIDGVDNDGDGFIDEDPPGYDNDGDGFINEDAPPFDNDDGDSWADDPAGTPGVYDPEIDEVWLDFGTTPGVVDAGDTLLFEGATPDVQGVTLTPLIDEDPMPFRDDDDDGNIDEDWINGLDDDGDNLVDEDPLGVDSDGDGRVDEDTKIWPDFRGRIVGLMDITEWWSYTADGVAEDAHFHGSHVAGIALGTGEGIRGRYGSWALWKYAGWGGFYPPNGYTIGPMNGVAPGASLVSIRMFGDPLGTWNPNYAYIDERTAYAMARAATGMVIGSNSWGEDVCPTPYSLDDALWDAFVHGWMGDWDGDGVLDPPITMVFSAGNEGPGPYTICAPADSKNVITVGASNTPWFLVGYPGEGVVDAISFFSSRGPTLDGRVKPDIVAPGWWVANADSGYSEYPYFWDPISGINHPVQSYYNWVGGTSQAAPHASGYAALWQQWSNDLSGVTLAPESLKAIMIQSANDLGIDPLGDTDLDGTGPNGIEDLYDRGWGRLDYFYWFDVKSFAIDDPYIGPSNALATDQWARYVFKSDGTMPLNINLVWSDWPGTPGAARDLVNNLDLIVVDPNHNTYWGNDLIPPYDDQEDVLNNVENVVLNSPVPGAYNVYVYAQNVPMGGAQNYALTVSGEFTDFNQVSPVGGTQVPLDRVNVLVLTAFNLITAHWWIPAILTTFVITIMVYKRRRK